MKTKNLSENKKNKWKLEKRNENKKKQKLKQNDIYKIKMIEINKKIVIKK